MLQTAMLSSRAAWWVPRQLGPLKQGSQNAMCWIHQHPSHPQKGKKKNPRKKVLLNLFLSWRLQAPVAEFEGKQGCLASWEFLAGREMTWRSSLSFISPDHRSQISQGSSALALLPPAQVPLGPTQKLKYCHHVFTLNQFSVLTSCSDWAQSPGCCQIFGYLNPSSQFFC